MYAVIKTGGKQYKVAKDQIVVVEKLAAASGDSVAFDQVLLVGEDEKTTLGAPTVAGACVMGGLWRSAAANQAETVVNSGYLAGLGRCASAPDY